MHYVYVLFSKRDSKLYIGCTQDLKKRLARHNAGMVTSTKDRIPLILIAYEAYMNKTDALRREQWLKTGWGRLHLKKVLLETLKKLGG